MKTKHIFLETFPEFIWIWLLKMKIWRKWQLNIYNWWYLWDILLLLLWQKRPFGDFTYICMLILKMLFLISWYFFRNWVKNVFRFKLGFLEIGIFLNSKKFFIQWRRVLEWSRCSIRKQLSDVTGLHTLISS